MKSFTLFVLLIFTSMAQGVDYFFNLGSAISNENIEDLAVNSDFHIAADAGFILNAGVIFPLMQTRPQNFELQLSFGAKTSGDKRDEDKNKYLIKWDRFPLELAYYYRHHRANMRLGYGYIYQLNGQVKGEGIYKNRTTDIENSSGFTLNVEKLIKKKSNGYFSLMLKYTRMTFKNEKLQKEIKSNSYSFLFGLLF